MDDIFELSVCLDNRITFITHACIRYNPFKSTSWMLPFPGPASLLFCGTAAVIKKFTTILKQKKTLQKSNI